MRLRHAVLACLLALGLAFGGCSGCEKGKTDLLTLIPADAPGAVVFPDLAGTVVKLRALKEKFSTGPLGLFLSSGHNELVSRLGFDPLKTEDLQKLGLAPAKGLAVVPAPFDRSFVAVGVSDRKLFEADLRRRMKELFAAEAIEDKKLEGLTVHSLGLKMGETFAPRLHYGFCGDFALLAGPDTAPEHLAALARLEAEKSLARAAWYKGLSSRMPERADLLVVVNGQKAEAIQLQAATLKQYLEEGVAVGVALSPTGVSVEFFLGMDEKSAKRLNAFCEGVHDEHLERYLPASSVLAVKARANAGRLLDEMLSLEPRFSTDLKRALDDARQAMQMDVEAATVRNLTGNLAFGLSLGQADNINSLLARVVEGQPPPEEAGGAFQVFLWAQVKDAGAYLQVIDKLLPLAAEKSGLVHEPARSGSLEAIRLTGPEVPGEVFLLHKGDLIGICSGRGCLETAAGLVDGQQKGVSSQMTPAAQALFERPSVLVGYANFSRMVDVLSSLDSSAFGKAGYMAKMVFGMVLTAVKNLKELTGVLRFEPGGMSMAGHLEIQ